MRCTILFLSSAIILFTFGCKTKPVPPNNFAIDTTSFFSIGNFFLSEIKDVETIPYLMYQIKTKANGTRDSSGFTNEEFIPLAKQFVACDISDSIKKQDYKEAVFKDNSTKSVTFNYSTTKRDLPIQSIDVLFNEETNKVNRIFIRKVLDNKDSSTTVLYSWKANMSFTITKSVVKQNGIKYTVQQYVNWNDHN